MKGKVTKLLAIFKIGNIAWQMIHKYPKEGTLYIQEDE